MGSNFLCAAAIIHNGECMLKDAMRQLEQLEHEIKEATKPVEDLWLNCDKCHKWRLVNQHVYDKYRRKGVKFYCQLLEDRPRELRSCSVEDDEVRRLRELNQAHGLLY